MHQVLHRHVIRSGTCQISLNTQIDMIREESEHLAVSVCNLSEGRFANVRAQALVGADGLWSATRQYVVPQTSPRVTGLIAYRALVPMQALPESLRTQDVTVWVGPQVHAVLYPVRRGEFLNLVVIVRASSPEPLED